MSLLSVIDSWLCRSRFYAKLRHSPLYWRMVHGTLWITFGVGISKAVAALSIIFVARILGKAEFGTYGVLRSTINTFASFAAFGLGVVGNTLIAKYRDTDKERTGRIISFSSMLSWIGGLLVVMLGVIFAPAIADKLLKAPELSSELYIALGVLFFQALHGNQLGILSGLEKFKAMVTINAVIELAGVALSIVGAFYFRLTGVMVGLLISSFLIYVVSEIYIHKFCRRMQINFRYDLRSIAENSTVLKLSVPTMCSAFCLWGGKWLADATVYRQEGGDMQMGIYTAVLTIQAVLMMFAVSLNAPLISIISNLQDGEAKKRFDKVNLLLPWMIAVIPSLPFILFPQMYAVLFGRGYSGAEFNLATAMTIIYSLLFIYRQGTERILLEKHLMWYSVAGNFLWSALLVLFINLLVKYGAVGFAVANVLAFALSSCICLSFYYYKGLIARNSIFSYRAWGIWGVTGACLAVFLLTDSLWLKGAVLAAAYLIFALLVLGMKRDIAAS